MYLLQPNIPCLLKCLKLKKILPAKSNPKIVSNLKSHQFPYYIYGMLSPPPLRIFYLYHRPSKHFDDNCQTTEDKKNCL